MPPFTSPAVTVRLSPRLASQQHAQLVLLSRSRQPVRPQHAALVPLLSGRASSMSAIVRGLRRTFRDPKGKRPPGYNPEVAAHVTKRRLEREAAVPPNYRLFRGKKDVTEPAVPKAKTRRARFFDPEDEYGKKSLVYQAKTGALDAEVKSLTKQLRRDLDNGEQGTARDGGSGHSERAGRGTRKPGTSSFGRREERDSGRPSDHEDAFGKVFNNRHDTGSRRERRDFGEDHTRRDVKEAREHRDYKEDRGQGYWGDRKRGQDRGQDRDQRRDRDRQDTGRSSRRYESTSSPPVPVAIPYTTAASQFLYGRSVVEAALRSARRRLYKLYIYNGENPSSTPQYQSPNSIIKHLATRRGVRVQLVDGRWQRLLDKMTKGRPHNGFVLEASPLPQPPLAALGPVVTNQHSAPSPATAGSPFQKGPGFRVELAHQSLEDADINGKDDFVPIDTTMVKHHRPLVLLLDQVLDPGNLGAILRSASFLGVSAVVVSRSGSAKLTSVALKASAGAAETMSIFYVETPMDFLVKSRQAGWKVYAAVAPPRDDAGAGTSARVSAVQRSGRKPVFDLDGIEAADPLATDGIILAMGSEGEGLPKDIRRLADVHVTIANRSGSNVVDSLNVNVATGLLCASLLKSARKGEKGGEGEEEAEEQRQETKAPDELNIF
ncbi:hypothetical protein SCUCBS95973_004604 [Sporothrix curviconia]|uniref:rRNA methyltransferase 1, mitochondrial n=1 Tax=Sporothrix curviconia TaxID=1260050 RepID=A0ABP0BQN9_9PEZI